ncbi:hypothetical protein HN51_011206 [Arachis hypogaea]
MERKENHDNHREGGSRYNILYEEANDDMHVENQNMMESDEPKEGELQLVQIGSQKGVGNLKKVSKYETSKKILLKRKTQAQKWVVQRMRRSINPNKRIMISKW